MVDRRSGRGRESSDMKIEVECRQLAEAREAAEARECWITLSLER